MVIKFVGILLRTAFSSLLYKFCNIALFKSLYSADFFYVGTISYVALYNTQCALKRKLFNKRHCATGSFHPCLTLMNNKDATESSLSCCVHAMGRDELLESTVQHCILYRCIVSPKNLDEKLPEPIRSETWTCYLICKLNTIHDSNSTRMYSKCQDQKALYGNFLKK